MSTNWNEAFDARINAVDPLIPPGRIAWLLEMPRAVWSIISHGLSQRELAAAPRGDGRPILLLPGLVNTDRSNFLMHRFLKRIGYRPYDWLLGRNLGARVVGPEAEKLIERVEAVHAETGEKVTLIGVSLGGIMARMVAQRRPDLVREVITISSPFAGSPIATNVWRTYELLTGEKIGDAVVMARIEEASAPLQMPSTAIWSRSDGLVNGLICHNDNCQAIEVRSSHMGVQMKPAVLLKVAEVLAAS